MHSRRGLLCVAVVDWPLDMAIRAAITCSTLVRFPNKDVQARGLDILLIVDNVRFWEMLHLYLIEAEWRIYATVNYATIGSDNGLSPIRC